MLIVSIAKRESDEPPLLSRPPDRVLRVLPTIAGGAEDLKVFNVVRSAQSEGHDVIDVKPLRHAPEAVRALPPLLGQQGRHLLRRVSPFGRLLARPPVPAESREFVRVVSSPPAVPG